MCVAADHVDVVLLEETDRLRFPRRARPLPGVGHVDPRWVDNLGLFNVSPVDQLGDDGLGVPGGLGVAGLLAAWVGAST